MHQAYPGDVPTTPEGLEAARGQAQWEGTLCPSQWTPALSRELVHALFEVGYPQAARIFRLVLNSVR